MANKKAKTDNVTLAEETTLTEKAPKLSDVYFSHLKGGFTNLVLQETQRFLVDFGGGKAMFPFYIHPPDSDTFNYYLIEDLDDSKGYDSLEYLIDSYMSNFNVGDHLVALIDGKTVKAVKFYIATGVESLQDALPYKDTVGINHRIFTINGDTFVFSAEGKIEYSSEAK